MEETIKSLNIRERAELAKQSLKREYDKLKGEMSRDELLDLLSEKYGYAVSTIEKKIIYH